MQAIQNRRFMFSPQTGELILGKQYRGSALVKSHAEEHGESGAKAPFDSFIRGWIGTGRSYKDGVIHFAPAIDAHNTEQFDRAFSVLEMFSQNGANGKTVIRGFGDVWEQPLSDLVPERSDRMSEVFSIMLDNRAEAQNGGPHGCWLDLPTTAEKLQEAMREIHITADNPQDFFINGYSCPEDRHLALPYDMVLAADVDELNFLAARLEALAAAALAELNAALQNPRGGFENIGQIIDYADNVDYFVHIPDVQTTAQLGSYYLNRSGMVDMPEEWKAGIDTARFGEHIAKQEQGAFTPYGYLVKSGDEWQRVHEGQPVPEEYRVMAYPAPEADQAAFHTEPFTPAAVLPEAAPIILKGKTKDEYMKEITDRLEAGVRGILDSENYKSYLTSMSKFHAYSFRNTMLIFLQKPDASHVAGAGKWQSEFERTRKKGERGLKILAPNFYTVKKRVPRKDPATGEPIKDKTGKTMMDEKEITVPDYRVVSVYDVSQTEGKEFPEAHADLLPGDVEQFQDLQAALAKASPYPISIEPILDGAKGRCHYAEQRIAVNEGMSELQTLQTAIHEVAHARQYEKNSHLPAEKRPDKATREVQAESVAYAVCQYWGLDTSDYSFGYIANWSSGRDLKELQASLETIRSAANDLINEMEINLLELQKQRQAQQEQTADTEQEPQAWNGIDGLLNGEPFMPEATPNERANALIDLAEKDGQQLGNGERRLIVDYAEAVDDTPKLIALVNDLCEHGYEIQHGEVNPAVKSRIEQEITEARAAQPALDPAAEPVVTIIWSESAHLKDGQQMPLHEADALFKALDAAQRHDREQPGHTGGWYDKTKFRIDFTMQGQPDSYEGRQDFGDGDGSLIEHIQSYHEYYAQDEHWKNHVLHHEGPEAWEADKAQREMLLNEFIPYMKQHCNLSRMEQEAKSLLQSGEPLPPEQTAYLTALVDYVKECRPLLNQGQYQLPEPPKLSDFDQSLQEYKEQVQAEIAQEAESHGMTVEEYAANDFEPYSTAEQAPETTPTPETNSTAGPQEPAAATTDSLTPLQKQALEIADRYKNLPLKEKIGVIAQTFGCKTGEIHTSPCTGKWRGTSDISIKFDNGASLFIGNHLTPKAKTVKVQTACVDGYLSQYNPEIVQATKETAMSALLKKEARDNEIAAQKGLKPYMVLNVELNDGSNENTGGYIGWYYVTLAVDGKICTHLETGLNYDIANGRVSETPTRADYFAAGALKETDVDYIFNNVGFSSASTLYALPLNAAALERAKKTLAQRMEAQTQKATQPEQTEPTAQATFSIYQVPPGPEGRDYRYRSYEELRADGLTVDRANYQLVYTAPLDKGTTLDDIFRRFNMEIPSDFKGHSLSMSDIVVFQQEGQQTAYYVDEGAEYRQVPEFLVQQESPIKAAEMTTEQNYNMIDGVLNNAPSPGEVEAKEKAGEQLTFDDIKPEPPPEQVAEAQQDTQEPKREPSPADYYYSINEGAARRAKEANSFDDYRPGSATAEYRHYVDEAFALAQAQKKRVDPMYHEKIDHLLDTYAKKLAANMNQGYAIDARVPSIMIAGGSNFPVRKKEKQNAARDTNMQEWQYIQGLLDKIRSVGTGGIRQDDPQAISKLQKKLDGLEKLQETMKAVNAYYRKHKTLDGCPALTPEQVEKLKASMEGSWRAEPRPFESFQLTNNNAEIRRLRQRIESLTRANEVAYVGWEFDGGHVEASREQGRLQVFFEDKPDADARQQLKDNGFRWAPSAGAWQRLLNDNAYHAANRVPCIQPLTGEKPTDLQRHSSREQREQKAAKEEKPSIRAQLAAAKEEQGKKPPAREKSKELEV